MTLKNRQKEAGRAKLERLKKRLTRAEDNIAAGRGTVLNNAKEVIAFFARLETSQ
jgi:hypothetical protein